MADLLFPLRSPAKSRMGSPMSLPEKVVVPDVIAIGSGMAAAGAAERRFGSKSQLASTLLGCKM